MGGSAKKCLFSAQRMGKNRTAGLVAVVTERYLGGVTLDSANGCQSPSPNSVIRRPPGTEASAKGW